MSWWQRLADVAGSVGSWAPGHPAAASLRCRDDGRTVRVEFPGGGAAPVVVEVDRPDGWVLEFDAADLDALVTGGSPVGPIGLGRWEAGAPVESAPPPPADVVVPAELDGMPRIPHGDLRVRAGLRGGPLADHTLLVVFDEGRVRHMGDDADGPVDVHVRVDMATFFRFRVGEAGFYDLLERDAEIEGPLSYLQLLAGLTEWPGNKDRVRAAVTPCGLLLAWLSAAVDAAGTVEQ